MCWSALAVYSPCSAPIPSPRGGLELEVVDLDGARLLPGFIDGHVHVTGGGGEGGFATRITGLPLSRYTQNGVTSVIGLLGTDDCARSTARTRRRPATPCASRASAPGAIAVATMCRRPR